MLGIGGSGLDSVADGRAIGKDNGRAELGRASVKIEGGRKVGKWMAGHRMGNSTRKSTNMTCKRDQKHCKSNYLAAR